MPECGCGGHSNIPYENKPHPNMPYDNKANEYGPYMQMLNIPQQYYPMVTMPHADLKSMYPQVYYMVHPAVEHYCDMMGIKHGMTFTPTRDQLDSMVEGIAQNVEGQMDMDDGMMGEMETRQPIFGGGFGGFGFSGRRFLRDLIGILLIEELLSRRSGWGGYGGYGGYYGY